LVSAGLAKGRKLTGFFSIYDDLRNAGAIVLDKKFVRDGNIITGTGPEAMPGMFKILFDVIREKGWLV
jgi:protease I